MSRVLTVILIFLLGVVAALLVLGYFAYMIRSGPPEQLSVSGLDSAAEVSFNDQGMFSVRAATLADAMAGLGYAQSASQTWPLVVYRAAATGRLSSITGEAGVAVDELVLRLGIASGAEAAYSSLPESDRELLEAFARGINAGLSSRPVTRDPSLVLSGYVPETWRPWHTIAVERMFAWLAAAGADERGGSPAVRPIRDALLLHDFGESTIVTSEWPAEPGLYVRYVWGSSALPVLVEATLDVDGSPRVRGACLTGTPFFIAGRRGGRAWAFLLEQSLREDRVIPDSAGAVRDYEVMTLPDGSEMLVSKLRTAAGVATRAVDEKPPGEPVTVVSWPGLGPVTDTSAWLSLLHGGSGTFRLIQGRGVELSGEGRSAAVTADGRSLVAGHMLGRYDFSPYAAERTDSLMLGSASFNPRLWFGDTYSPWAQRWAPVVAKILDEVELDPAAREAHSYLRNWDYGFDGASIAASIFHTWAREFHDLHGQWPGLDPTSSTLLRPDTLISSPDVVGPFINAVGRLTASYGSDLSLWRWEDVGASEIYFPILGKAGRGTGGREISRYSPRTVPGNGHPSTPNWSPAAVPGRAAASNSWEGWTRLTVRDEWTVRRWYPDVRRGIGSSRAPDEGSRVASLETSGGLRTRLVQSPE